MTDCKHNKRIICEQEACARCGFAPDEAKLRRSWMRSKGLHKAMGRGRFLWLRAMWGEG